jgi:hypothetical protein
MTKTVEPFKIVIVSVFFVLFVDAIMQAALAYSSEYLEAISNETYYFGKSGSRNENLFC